MTRARDIANVISSADLAGQAIITTADNNPQLTLISTDADASVGPVMILKRDSASPADDDALGFLKFDGENSASEQTTYASINARSADVTDSTEDGKLDIFTIQNGSSINRQSFNTTETVFNEDSKDIDFRVESDGNANMLKVDASVNGVAIGGGVTSGYQLQINNASGSVQQLLSAGANFNSTIAFGDPDLNDAGEIIYAHNGNSMRFHTNDTERLRIDSSGNALFNTTSSSGDVTLGTRVIGGFHNTRMNVHTFSATSSFETVETFSSNAGTYLLTATGSGGGNATTDHYIGFVSISNSSAVITDVKTASRVSVQMSGLSLQISQTFFSTANITYSLLRLVS